MSDNHKTKRQLIEELEELRRQLAACQESEARCRQAFEESEAKWRSVVANAPVFISVVDGDATILFPSRNQPGMTVEEAVGKSLCDDTDPQYHDSVGSSLHDVFSTGQRTSFQSIVAGPHGTNCWYETVVGPVEVEGRVVAATVIARDITDHKLTEEALQRTEERFRKVFEEGPMGIALVGLDARIEHVNPRFCEMLGYSEEEITALGVLGITHPDDRESDHELRMRLLQGEIPSYAIEKRYVRKDGQVIWVHLTASMMHDAQGQPTAVIGMVKDISERKQVEAALRESEARYRLLTESVPQAVWQTDPEGNVLDCNSHWCEYTGQTPEEAKNDGWSKAIHPGDLERVFHEVKEDLARGEIYECEQRVRRASDGTYRWHLARGVPVKDDKGKLTGWIGSTTDIHDQKTAAEALEKAHDELEQKVRERTAELAIFHQFAEASGKGFGMADLDGCITYVNRTLCRLVGEEKPEDVIGKYVSTYYPGEHSRERRDEIADAVLQHDSWQGEQVILSRHGTLIPAFENLFLIRDESGKPFRFGVAIADISELKRTEAALERERQSLWKMLQASDHERQTISYEIHDGLAQYLAAAGMQFQAYEALKENSPDEARRAYDTAVALVRQAHSESRRLISEVRPPIIDEIGLETALSHLVHEQRASGGPKIEFHSSVQFGRLASILENSLYRIAQEALTNACKHSKSKKVTVTLSQQGQEVWLEIRDRGIGFDSGSVEKGRFGLEGIRQRVRLLGGRLTIDSKPGSGTLIQVVVPVVERGDEG